MDEATTSTDKKRLCHCGRQAALAIAGGKLPLCMDCYVKFKSIEHADMQNLRMQMNYLHEQIQMITGIPMASPRFPDPQPVFQPVFQTGHNIQITDSNVGMLNTGQIEQVARINIAMTRVENREMATALEEFTQAVVDDQTIAPDVKAEVLDLVEGVSNSARNPGGGKKALVLPWVLRVSTLVQGVAALAQLWDRVAPYFN
jgi:hypothetical protein